MDTQNLDLKTLDASLDLYIHSEDIRLDILEATRDFYDQNTENIAHVVLFNDSSESPGYRITYFPLVLNKPGLTGLALAIPYLYPSEICEYDDGEIDPINTYYRNAMARLCKVYLEAVKNHLTF